MISEKATHQVRTINQVQKERKQVGNLSLIALIETILWLALLVFGMIRNGPVETIRDAVAVAWDMDMLFFLTYVNAALITLTVTALFAGLYILYREVAPLWSAVALSFVPVYTVLNLFVYLSQITILPKLLPVEEPAVNMVVVQMLQQWPGSIVSMLNNLAYAILGIPSIILGILIYRRIRMGGVFLVLNGAACILGFMGLVADSQILSSGTLIGGVLFLLALIPMAIKLLNQEDSEIPKIKR